MGEREIPQLWGNPTGLGAEVRWLAEVEGGPERGPYRAVLETAPSAQVITRMIYDGVEAGRLRVGCAFCSCGPASLHVLGERDRGLGGPPARVAGGELLRSFIIPDLAAWESWRGLLELRPVPPRERSRITMDVGLDGWLAP